jgi:SAM-dependent methyltransferase
VADATGIARYYDRSTRRFLRMGGSGTALAIHRPLWAPGIRTTAEAADHVNHLCATLAEEALARTPSVVVDLGCGVGGTLLHFGRRWPQARLLGLTLSATQADIARAEAGRSGLAGRCTIRNTDFLREAGAGDADLVVAIESHVHAPDPDRFLSAAATRLAPGGILLVVDDMLARAVDALAPRDRRLVETFRRGWHLGHVSTPDALSAAARAVGLREIARRDLGPFLRLDRLRDHLLRAAGPVADALGLVRVPLFANMIGGNALTIAHRRGVLAYIIMAWQRP